MAWWPSPDYGDGHTPQHHTNYRQLPDCDTEYSTDPRDGAPDELVDAVAQIAGDGDLDERASRILAAMRHRWGLE